MMGARVARLIYPSGAAGWCGGIGGRCGCNDGLALVTFDQSSSVIP